MRMSGRVRVASSSRWEFMANGKHTPQRFLRVAVGILCDLRCCKSPDSGDLPNFNWLSIGTPYAQLHQIVMHSRPERVRGATMARHLFIVSRHHARLYDYLVE